MKLLKHLFICTALLASAALLFVSPQVSQQAIVAGLCVCVGSILPSLFPFFVFSNLWISLGYAQKLSQKFSHWMARLFHLPGEAASALLLGAVGGYPVGAQTAVQLYLEKRLTKDDTSKVLFFCNNAGPAFVFGIIGGGLFQSAAIAAVLWAIHLGSSLLLGILFRPVLTTNPTQKTTAVIQTPFLPALTCAIGQAGQTTLMVCTFVLFFSILSGYLHAVFPTFCSSLIGTILLGSLELAGGCYRLGALGLSQEAAFIACSGLLGWGGLCVHCQTTAALSAAGLSANRYLSGKALHALVSAALACLIAPLLPLQVPCFAVTKHPPIREITLLSCLLLLLILKSSSGKMAKHHI